MPFVTKLDYSDNRQIKQFELTNTQLSGTTEFGVPFSALTSVLDSSITLTSTLTGITSTFSGNTTTTNISFGDPRMVSGAVTLSVITDITSGDTQQGYGFNGVGPYEIDGNTLYTSYTGSSYDFSVTSIEEVATDQWTGETISNLVTILSGASDDFTGRTIRVDVLGLTKTRRLILDDIPDVYSGATHLLTRGISGDVLNFPLSGLSAQTTNTDDYVESAIFDDSNGDLTLTRLSGTTMIANLDGRYTIVPSTGLERIDEGNGDGWRLIGRDPTYYGNIGLNAIDFSYSTTTGTTKGSTQEYGVTFGRDNENNQIGSLVGGFDNSVGVINGQQFGVRNIVWGMNNLVQGMSYNGGVLGLYHKLGHPSLVWPNTFNSASFLIGSENTMPYGYGSVHLGVQLSGNSPYCTTVGVANEDVTITPASPYWATMLGANPRFIVGNGTRNGSTAPGFAITRSNAFEVYQSGDVIAPSLTTTLIDAEATGRVLVTREYLTGSTSGFTGSGDDYTTGATLSGLTLEFTRLSGGTYNVELSGFSDGKFIDGTDPLDAVYMLGSVGINDLAPGPPLSVIKLSPAYTSGSTEHILATFADIDPSNGNGVGGLLLGYFADGVSASVGHVRSLGALPLWLGTANSKNGIIVEDNGRVSTPNMSIPEIDAGSVNTLVTREYLTGSTSGFTGSGDDYTTGATFNTTTRLLELTRQSGATYNVDITAPDRLLEVGNTGPTLSLDFDAYELWRGTVDEAVTISIANGKPKVVTVDLTGDFAITYPANSTVVGDEYMSSCPGINANGGTMSSFPTWLCTWKVTSLGLLGPAPAGYGTGNLLDYQVEHIMLN